MMHERSIDVDHSTLNRWVLKYAPELDKRIRPHLQLTNDTGARVVLPKLVGSGIISIYVYWSQPPTPHL